MSVPRGGQLPSPGRRQNQRRHRGRLAKDRRGIRTGEVCCHERSCEKAAIIVLWLWRERFLGLAVRTFLIVACLPLLLPPGFCICKLGWFDSPRSEPTSTGSQCNQSEPLKKKHCCSHDHDHDDGGLSGIRSDSGQPKPVDHEPGCLAVVTLNQATASASSSILDHLAFDTEMTVQFNVRSYAPSTITLVKSTSGRTSYSLYSLRCALLI